MSQNERSFMDRSTITAVVIVMIFWVGWSFFMEKKYPQPKPEVAVPTAAPTTAAPAPQPTMATAKAQPTAVVPAAPQEQVIQLETPQMRVSVSSLGMALKQIELKDYRTREDKPVFLGQDEQSPTLSTGLVGDAQPLAFQLRREGPEVIVGVAETAAGKITKRIQLRPASYRADTEITVENPTAQFQGVRLEMTDRQEEKKSGFLMPSYDRQEFYLRHEGTNTRVDLDAKKDAEAFAKGTRTDAAMKNVELVALNHHYFSQAILDQGSAVLPSFERTLENTGHVSRGVLTYTPINRSENMTVKYTAFAGPKNLQTLQAIDPRMSELINYGTFSWIAQPLLGLLKFFFSLVGNYGVAIILLTLLVRGALLPLNVYSYRSMKVMQKLQPQIKQLQERYKEDKVRQNQEVMQLMKSNKANPLGGCLPMLLQLPIFFALYSALAQSIELYRAPFAFWIRDLSAADHFFVLPILMGISMYYQQKMTPTAMDPAQQKVMQFMPLVFSLFMLSLPSGLTLYMFVSGLFGIAQTYFFMKERRPNTTVSAAKA